MHSHLPYTVDGLCWKWVRAGTVANWKRCSLDAFNRLHLNRDAIHTNDARHWLQDGRYACVVD